MKTQITKTEIKNMARAIKQKEYKQYTATLLIYKDCSWKVELNTGCRYENPKLALQINFNAYNDLPNYSLSHIGEIIFNRISEYYPKMLFKRNKWTYEEIIKSITG